MCDLALATREVRKPYDLALGLHSPARTSCSVCCCPLIKKGHYDRHHRAWPAIRFFLCGFTSQRRFIWSCVRLGPFVIVPTFVVALSKLSPESLRDWLTPAYS